MYSRMAMITFMSGGPGDYPDQGLPSVPGRPDNSLPGVPGHPGNALPPPGSIATLPVFPFDPTRPDQGLPGGEPPPTTKPIVPGAKFIVKWLACYGLILVPDNELPQPEVNPQ